MVYVRLLCALLLSLIVSMTLLLPLQNLGDKHTPFTPLVINTMDFKTELALFLLRSAKALRLPLSQSQSRD